MRKRLSVEEMEEVAKIPRSEQRRPSPEDAKVLERKMLGPLWGKPRRKMKGWP